MEALVFLFILGIVVFLNWPEPPPPEPDVWVDLGKAIGKVVNKVFPPKGDN